LSPQNMNNFYCCTVHVVIITAFIPTHAQIHPLITHTKLNNV